MGWKDMSGEVISTIRSVWESHKDEEYRRDQSHWRGCGRWKDDAVWQKIGQGTLEHLQRITRYLGTSETFWTQKRSMLEWGPGGGANLFALKPFASVYYGIDISESNLGEAGRLDAESPPAVFKPVLIGEDVSVVSRTVSEPVELFLSTAVFQHFPGKDYGVRVLQELARAVRPGGIGYIQIRYDNGNEYFKPISTLQEYARKHITANSYMIDEFSELCTKAGFEVLYVTGIRVANNYASYALRRKG